MSLQVVAFRGFGLPDGNGNGILQLPDGEPVDVTANTFTGTYTVPAGVRFVKLSGTGTVTWTTDATPEDISGVEFRGVRPAQTFVVG
jgi:hypothetical protein